VPLWQRVGIAGLIALLLAFLAAYFVVVSQNPAASVSGPPFVYGPVAE
jgi:hypothetical protein